MSGIGMRILFVTMQFGRSYTQGTERYISMLSECLRQRGHEVVVLAGDPLQVDRPRPLGAPVDEGRQILALPARGWMTVVGGSARRIEAWLKQYRPDLVHVANPAHVGVAVMGACGRLGIPLVVTTMDFWWVCPKATLLRPGGVVCDATPGWSGCIQCIAADHARAGVRWLGRLPRALSPLALSLYFARAAMRGMSPADMVRWMRRRSILVGHLDAADQVIFPSGATREVIQPHLSHDRWKMVPYGLPGRWFENRRRPAARAKPPEALTIGYAGAILPHKGPHLLLAAVREMGWNRCRVRLAGPPGDPAYLRVLKGASQGLNVEFAGQLSRDEMVVFLRSLDILAMTSLWPENLPFIVLEAHAAGVPVVASNVAGVAEQIGNRRLLFPPGSVEALARALDYVREHPDAARQARVHTIEEMTDATEVVYRAALARPGGR